MKDKYIKLSKNSFVRFYDDGALGYITNQLTKQDRAYNETGADFLKQITRKPRTICECVEKLKCVYEDVSIVELENDFTKFVENLAKVKFVLIGDDYNGVDSSDFEFSYSMENPKTMIADYTQQTDEDSEYETQSYLLKHDDKFPRLTSMQFELTSLCNERCIHCYIPSNIKDNGVRMPLPTFKKTIDQFVELGGLDVTLSGGEALLHKDIAEMLRYCREKDLQITILSNLTLLKDELIPVLKETNVSQIQVSLYSMNPDTHDMITTVKGSFKKTKKAIEKLYAADVPVQISCPAMKENYKDFIDVAKYAQSLKMKAHCDYNLIAQEDTGTENLQHRLSLPETEELLKSIVKFNTNYQELIATETQDVKIKPEEMNSMPLCGVGRNTLCITANGDIFPCAGWQDYVVGNIYKTTLKEVWNNNEKVRELRTFKKSVFPQCMTCDAVDYCAPCLVANYNESGGDMFKLSEHRCATSHINKRIVEEWLATQSASKK